jgi:hypothetical protein
MTKIEQWVEDNNLKVEFFLPWLKLDGAEFLLLGERDDVFDSSFNLNLTDQEYDLAGQADYLVFLFGDKYYYTDIIKKPKLVEFKYIGEVSTIYPQPDFPYLGIHGGYDLCNGSRTYREWVKKANFLGIKTLGIAEDNTLAGVLSFQEECEKKGIRSIIGETITVRRAGTRDFRVKLYCLNREKGWTP